MRIPTGTVDQVIYFVAVDITDLKTRETGLTAFTVYRSRDGGAAAIFITPTVTELSAANMPGVYSLLLDEDMNMGAGNDSEEVCYHITQASMAPVTRTIELYRPKITQGETLTSTASGEIKLPTIPISWITASGINTAALNGKGNWNVGKTGYQLSAAGVDDIWDEPMVAHGTADTSGLVMNEWQDGGRLDVILDARMAETSINTTGGAVDTVTTTATATNLTNAPTNGDLTATMKTSVTTSADNALNVTTYAEPAQGIPTATTTLVDKIGYLYKVLRNRKTSTTALINIYNDDGTTVDHKRTISDDGSTYDETEIVSGP